MYLSSRAISVILAGYFKKATTGSRAWGFWKAGGLLSSARDLPFVVKVRNISAAFSLLQQ
jgi:hypothetical protein